MARAMSSLLASSTTSTSKPSCAQRRGQAAGIVDRLRQRRGGVGIMAIADHQRDPGGALPTSTLCSVATALAASSARLFSAAWAPIASDTRPTRAAAMVTERREMRTASTFIGSFPIVVQAARQISRANAG